MESAQRRNVAVGATVTVILAAGGAAMTVLLKNSDSQAPFVWPIIWLIAVVALALIVLIAFWGWWPRWTSDDLTWESRPAKHSLNRDVGKLEPQGTVVVIKARKALQPTRVRVVFAELIDGAVTASLLRGRQLTYSSSLGPQTTTVHHKANEVECVVSRRRVYVRFSEPALATRDLVQITLAKTPADSQRVLSVRRREI